MATEAFYSGQPDYIEKLNFLYGVAEATQGPDGWTPNLVVTEDGPRLVIEVVSWSGGTGTPPGLGYLSDTGVVPNIEDATNIRGTTGLTGSTGPSNVLAIGTVTEGVAAEATITGTSPSQVLNLVLPKGNTGDDGREVEFNKSATHLQWRYVGEVTWIDLVLLSEITGPSGNNGTDGTNGTNGTNGDDGRGIVSVVQTAGDSSPGSVDTYTITYTDATTDTFDVYNGNDGTNGTNGTNGDDGRGILSVAQTAGDSSPGTTDTYTITYTDATTSTFDVYNGNEGTNGTNGTNGDDGRGIVSVVQTAGDSSPGSTDTYTITYTDATTDTFDVYNGADGADGAGAGDVVGPAASVDNEVALFDGVTGKLVKGGGVLNTGAYAEEDRWKLQGFIVMMAFQGATPTSALGTYYPQSDVLAANGHTAIRAVNGDVYTMTDGVWVLTNPFNASPNGSRMAFAQVGDLGPFWWTRSAGSTVRTLMQQGSGNIRYSEGTAGVDFANYTVRAKLDQIGRLINLTTTDKTSIVAAINELVSSKLGDAPSDGDEYVRKDGAWAVKTTGAGATTWAGITDKPAVIAAGANAAAARAAIGAGTSDLTLGTTASTALPGNTVVLPDAPSDGKNYVRKDAAWGEIPPSEDQTTSITHTYTGVLTVPPINLPLVAIVASPTGKERVGALYISPLNTGLVSLEISEVDYIGGFINIPTTLASLTTLSFPELITAAASFGGSTMSALTTLNLPKLAVVGVSFTTSTLNALISLNLPELRIVGSSFTPGIMSSLTTLSVPSLEIVGANFGPANMSSLTTLTISSLTTVGGHFNLNNMAALTTLSAPALTTVGGNLSPSTMASLTTMSFPELTDIGGVVAPATMGSLTTFDLPKIERISPNSTSTAAVISFVSLTGALTTFELPATLKQVGGTAGNVAISSAALNQTSVDSILTRLAALDGTAGTTSFNNRNVVITGTSSTPSATGLAAKAVLQSRGCMVTHN